MRTGSLIKQMFFICVLMANQALMGNEITIGSKKFTENIILADIASQYLELNGSRVVHRRELGGTRILWEALLRGDLDVYPDYTGTLQYEILKQTGLRDWAELKKALAAHGVGLTRSLGFNNTYGLGMQRKMAEKFKIRRMSDLRRHPQLKYGLGHEFLERTDGWPGLKLAYQLHPLNVKGMDHDIGYKAIESGAIDVLDIYTTDAEIEFYDLLVLEDDLAYFPRYEAVYLYRLDAPEAVKRTLESLAGSIEASEMIKLNAESKIQGKSAPEVAQQFLVERFNVQPTVVSQSLSDTILLRTKEHLFLVGISLGLAILVSIPLGLWASSSQAAGRIILATVGIIQTLPSLALLVVMIPLFGIGMQPALIALFLYSLLPIVRGTFHGFSTISRELRETAKAIGLSRLAQFRLIYWPLALSSILNGIKTSAVINVGTATLGALIGAGGYGQTILKGIRLDNTELILAGAVPAAVLALGVQGFFDLLERLLVSPGLRS